MTVHQLTESKAKAGRRTLVARCGATFVGRTSDPQPPDVTAWGSQVTCRACAPVSSGELPPARPRKGPAATAIVAGPATS